MSLKIINDKGEFALDQIELDDSTLVVSSDEADVQATLSVALNFDVQSSVNDRFKNLSGEHEDVYLLRNHFASQTDVVNLRVVENKDNNGNLGYIFNLSRFLDFDLADEGETLNEYIKTAVFRGVVKLILNETSLNAKTPEYRVGEEYLIQDFYDIDDLIILVIPKMFSSKVQEFSFEKQYTIPLYKYGYYFINRHGEFEENTLDLIGFNYSSLENDNSKTYKKLKIESVCKTIIDESYFETVSNTLVSQKSNYMIRFYFIYQVVEILSDKVLKREIEEYVASNLESTTGYRLKEKLAKFGTEQYRISRMFSSDYSNIGDVLVYELTIKLNLFLDENFADFNADDDNSYKLAFLVYKLRNIVVHNYRFVYEGDEEKITQRNDDLEEIMKYFEYTIFTIMGSFREKIRPTPQQNR